MVSSRDIQRTNTTQLLFENLENIEANWPVLPSGIWNPSAIRSAQRFLGDLARKSSHQGLVNISELCVKIDKTIADINQQSSQPDSEEITYINLLLEKLKQMISAIEEHDINYVTEASDYDLVFIHKDEDIGKQITDAIQKNGWRVLSISLIDDLAPILSKETVKVVLIDTHYIQDMDEVNRLIIKLRADKKNRPELIFLSDECNIEIRLEVLRTGATQCFTSPININDLMTSIKQILSPQVKPRPRVLIVEDDESQAQFASTLLRKAGMNTLVITNPLGVIEAVMRFQPDLILMDLYMPGANGIELTQIIRERKESLTIPIVFLSGEENMEKKLLALYSGADDFLTKPVRPQHLLATVKTRIDRAQTIFAAGAKGNTDYSTGLPNRKALLLKLDCVTQDMGAKKPVAGLFSVSFSDLEQDHHDTDYSNLLVETAKLVSRLLEKHDTITRSSETSLGILLKRNSIKEIEQIGAELYGHLKTNIDEEIKFGLGEVLIDSNQNNPDLLLTQSEAASIKAYRSQSSTCLNYQEQIDTPEEAEISSDDFQKQQFLSALNTALIEFRQQRFNSSHETNKEIIELTPKPAPATDIILISDDITLTAQQHKLSSEFNRYICKYALRMLGEFALTRNMTQVIISMTSDAINDGTLLEFIKAELRNLQLVGIGLMIEFDLPSLAKDLKQARYFLGELSAMGINTLLGNFACNETAYKVLSYLNAEGVRPHPSLLKSDYQTIQEISSNVHSHHAIIVLPRANEFGQVSLAWSEAADFVQSSYSE